MSKPKQYRIRADVYAWLQDAAGRFGFDMSEIARRACRHKQKPAYVHTAIKPHVCTRSEGVAIRAAGLCVDMSSPQLSAVIEWYLTEKDDGSRKPFAGETTTDADGVATYLGPLQLPERAKQ